MNMAGGAVLKQPDASVRQEVTQTNSSDLENL